MHSPFATSALFLSCYLWYHAHHGVTQGEIRARLALGMFFVLELLVTFDSAVRHGQARGVYFPYSTGRVVVVPRVRWCSEAVPAILFLIPLNTPLIY
jgi:hypothetical protein